jgi:preprotein translocase subunit SecF
MFYGMITGTYSTIFIATAIVDKWHKQSLREKETVPGSAAADTPAKA